jgi:hypothetical protein
MFSSADSQRLTGVEAVIDKDLASQLLARKVEADLLVRDLVPSCGTSHTSQPAHRCRLGLQQLSTPFC